MREMTEILVPSTMDGSLQPSLFSPAAEPGRPLLVGLHTWSCDRFNQVNGLLPLAEKHDWNLLLPEFRGPNLPENPHCREACGSEKAKQDILDAVDWVLQRYDIPEDRILLLGASGGGHMALLMAGYAPKRWRTVASFVPITDLAAWRQESDHYRPTIEACCGGTEAECPEEYRLRSPMTWAGEIARADLKIFTGKWDPSVPSHHGLDLYTKIFREHPEATVYFEMFDGGHEMRLEDAERWLLSRLESTAAQAQVTG